MGGTIWAGYIFLRKFLSQTKSLYLLPTTHPVSCVLTSNSKKDVAPMPKKPPMVFLWGLNHVVLTCKPLREVVQSYWVYRWFWCTWKSWRTNFLWNWTYPWIVTICTKRTGLGFEDIWELGSFMNDFSSFSVFVASSRISGYGDSSSELLCLNLMKSCTTILSCSKVQRVRSSPMLSLSSRNWINFCGSYCLSKISYLR